MIPTQRVVPCFHQSIVPANSRRWHYRPDPLAAVTEGHLVYVVVVLVFLQPLNYSTKVFFAVDMIRAPHPVILPVAAHKRPSTIIFGDTAATIGVTP